MMNKKLHIAISGASGCGNTTVTSLLAQKLNLPYINYTFRNLAKEMNIPFKEILEQAKTDFKFDKTIDSKQIKMASKQSCVLGSRLAIWLLKDANFKIYLNASLETRVQRIYNREGGDINEIKATTIERDSEDTRRYKKLYGIDNTKFEFADMIINTEKYSPEEIINLIVEKLTDKKLI